MLYLSTYISAIKRILPRAVLINLYNKKISKKPVTPEKKKKKCKKITLHGAQAKEIENTSWKVLAYGIYARVVDVSEIERVSAANE